MKQMSVWAADSPNPLTRDAFAVFRSGRELLRSPYGTFPGASVAPLVQKDGRTFGVLISGPGARPDELVHSIAKLAGPLIERAWKRAAAHSMGRLAATWVRQNADDSVTDTVFVRSATEHAPPEQWTPLPHQHGAALRLFSMPVRSAERGMLGTLDARVRNHVQLGAPMLRLFHTTGGVLQQLATEIGKMRTGDALPLTSIPEFSVRYYEAAGPGPLAARLNSAITSQLRALDPNKLIAEMRAYPTPDEKVTQVLIGVLTLFGRNPKTLKGWDDVKRELSSQLTKELLALDVTDATKGWAESARATKSLDLDALLTEAPLPVAEMLKWLMAVRIVRDVALSARKEVKVEDTKVEDTKTAAPEAAAKATAKAAGQAFAKAGKTSAPQSAAKKTVQAAGQVFGKTNPPPKGPPKGKGLGRLPGAGRARMRIAAAERMASKKAIIA